MTLKIDPSIPKPTVSFTLDCSKFVRPVSSRAWSVTSHSHVNAYLKGERLLNARFTLTSSEDLRGLPLPDGEVRKLLT